MKKIIFLSLLIALLCLSCSQKTTYTKHVTFPKNATLEQKVTMAAQLVPTKQQLAWQQLEMTAFLHFGVNTFTGREWGDGTENPSIFNPTALDAEQWVRTLKDSGFKLVILTAKHHDGFCLWPTKTTTHCVASSKWKEGKGDVVKALRDACTKYNLKFGVYLSPWDRNASCYGDSPRYNDFFIQQLTELLSNYGQVDEVWFDGACGEGPNGKKQVYDWTRILETIHKLQPQAVTSIMGDDVRWVGNEQGFGRETEWSASALIPGSYPQAKDGQKRLKLRATTKDLGSRDILKKATELSWYPSEVDVSIRPGWFYHTEQDSKVKSLKQLVNIYFKSVGYNSVLLLNIPPNRQGLISEADVSRLKEFSTYIKQTFAKNEIINGNKNWKASPKNSRIYKVKKNSKINVIVLQEDIRKGQRTESFEIEAFTNNHWEIIGKGTTIGYKRMILLEDAISTEKLRITINESRLKTHISNVAAYYAQPLEEVTNKEDWRSDASRKEWKLLSQSPFTLDLGQKKTIKGFIYAPLNKVAKATTGFKYKIYASMNGHQWKEIPSNGEFSNIMNNPLPQRIVFEQPVTMNHFKIVATTSMGKEAIISQEEIGLIEK